MLFIHAAVVTYTVFFIICYDKHDVFVTSDNDQFQRLLWSKDQYILKPVEILSQDMLMHIQMKTSYSLFRSYDLATYVCHFLKEKKVKSQGQQKDFITRNIYMKCKNSSTHCSKVFGKVKVFKL